MPFRTPLDAIANIEPPALRAPPALLGFSAAGHLYRAVYADHGAARVIEIDRRNGHTTPRASFALSDRTARSAMGRDHWGVFAIDASRVEAFDDQTPDQGRARALAMGDVAVPFLLEGRPHLAISHEGIASTSTRGPRATVFDSEGRSIAGDAWFSPPTSRSILGATSTVAGPVLIYSTDRDDEIDVSVVGRDGQTVQRTVSLGRGQRFECVQGGGNRLMIVSRDEAGITARTLASDIRSELNPVPLPPRTGWRIGGVRCAYANGPFAIAHVESRDERTVSMLTLFDAGRVQTQPIALPAVDAIVADGKDLCAATLVPSASAPVLLIHRGTRNGTHARHYAYFVEEPDVRTAYARHAMLVDLANIVARAMGARSPAGFVLHRYDEHGDVVRFTLPGLDSRSDVAMAVLLRDDGSGVTSVRVGGGSAPVPRGLAFVERMREAFTGDDDGDPMTSRVEHARVAHDLEAIVSAVGALRAAHGA